MPVKFTLDNANDSTPANNEVVVDVALQPAIECEVTATLSAPVTEPELGRHYFATVTVTNTSTVELSYVALMFGDIGGYEVRPVTAPQWDQDAGLLVSNPDWKEPYLYGSGVYLVALKPILQPGSSVDYHVRITRRTADINATVVFDVIGPCGYTGESAELEFSGDVSGSLWLLPADEDVNDHRPAALDETHLQLWRGEERPATITMELPNGAPEGTYLVVQNAMGAFTGTGGYGLYLDLDANPELTFEHAVQYAPVFSGYEYVRDAVYRIDQAILPGTHTLQAVVRVNNIAGNLMAWDHDPLPMVPILSTTTDIIPAGVPDAILSVTFNTMSVLVIQGS